MTKQDFLKKLFVKKDDLLSNYEFQKSVLLDLIEIGFIYVKNHYSVDDNKFANMMLQMSLLKANSILELSEGTKLKNVTGIENSIIDIQSQSSIFRPLFENYCFFNHLYIRNWSKEEFMLIENIWKISSLKQRFYLFDNSLVLMNLDDSSKIKNEKDFVLKLTQEIKNSSLYNKNKRFINNCLKTNKWQITINENKVIHISWKEMFKNSRKNKIANDKIYQIFSLDSHPSYFSVFQFGDLYRTRYDLSRRTTLIYQTIEMICNYLYDFEKLMTSKIEINIETKFLIEILSSKKGD
ncbi:hypothetical protein [Yeosuana marina]|uniref:hypothetical protein n=1 Tax=Yeosuana marina TaxID=1565536 RepID=UPI0030ED3209|tara:strand:+ start:676 stop:1560 length:885 start_codon:yes stop_codon:yes gene_type:complete